MIRRYVVTCDDIYYPAGGLGNVAGDFDDYAQAQAFARMLEADDWDHVEVYDLCQEPSWRDCKEYVQFMSGQENKQEEK